MPLIGPESLRGLAAMGKLAHNFLSLPVHARRRADVRALGQGQHPERARLEWLKQGGGYVRERQASAGEALQRRPEDGVLDRCSAAARCRSRAGSCCSPSAPADITGMQWRKTFTPSSAVIIVAAMLAHIYIGSLGMEGAFDAMGSRRGRSRLGQGAPLALGRGTAGQGRTPSGRTRSRLNRSRQFGL